jgi:predicted transcriptional regulator
MTKKRDRLEIIKDILESINQNRNIKPTRLLYASNLSPQMFKEYVTGLKEKNLIKEEKIKNKKYFVLTPKGNSFLEEYKGLSSFIRNFGL